jgi:streptogramin lyase
MSPILISCAKEPTMQQSRLSLRVVLMAAVMGILVLSLPAIAKAATAPLKLHDILVADRQGAISKIDPATGLQTVLNPLGIPYATGIAVEANGQVLVTSFVCDGCGGSYVPSVIRLDPAAGAWTTLTAGGFLHKPFGIAVDADGQILVTDEANVIQVDPVSAAQTMFVTGPPLQLGQGLAIIHTKPKR